MIRAKAQESNALLLPYTSWNIQQLYTDSNAHTAWKPLLYTDTGYSRGEGSWLKRKLLDEHLLFYEKNGFHICADFIPDFQIGNSSRGTKTPWTNTRAFRISGNVGSKIYFEAEDFENQARFPAYVDSYISRTKVIPGSQTFRRNSATSPYDFNSASARLVYMPYKMFQFDLGYGKNFIGDGHRSVLLSDWSFNYPYLKVTANYKSIQYSAMWSQYVSDVDRTLNNTFGYPRKWGQTFFLDWNFSPNGNIGLFESVIWPDQDVEGRRKDLSWTMASPIIFLHANNTPGGQANTTLTGLNAKYKILPRTHLYGQLAFSQFLRNSEWTNRFAAQLGLRSADVFGLKGLNINGEFNTAKPYAYAGDNRAVNYAHYNQSLAHPFGAYFTEGLIIASYQYQRWYVRGQAIIAQYHTDSATAVNAGHDIFKPLATASYDQTATIKTNLLWWDIRLAYIINPSANLRIEAGFTFRKEDGGTTEFNDRVFMIGLRSSFRQLLYDF
ncbi:MAG: hypothetical protein WC756_19640 [Taibaiella sp.]|jgi:hypothetical protein